METIDDLDTPLDQAIEEFIARENRTDGVVAYAKVLLIAYAHLRNGGSFTRIKQELLFVYVNPSRAFAIGDLVFQAISDDNIFTERHVRQLMGIIDREQLNGVISGAFTPPHGDIVNAVGAFKINATILLGLAQGLPKMDEKTIRLVKYFNFGKTKLIDYLKLNENMTSCLDYK